MDKYSKIVLIIFIAVVVGVVSFFTGRRVERNSILNDINKQTVMQNNTNDGYVDLDDVDNTYVPSGSYNDVTTNLNNN